MSKETHEIDVANGRIITLLGLTEEDKGRARSHEVSLARHMFGWPYISEEIHANKTDYKIVLKGGPLEQSCPPLSCSLSSLKLYT
jgi:hypothetical protein